MDSGKNNEVELLAYFIYIAEGRTEGHALDHWREAEYLIETGNFGADRFNCEQPCSWENASAAQIPLNATGTAKQ